MSVGNIRTSVLLDQVLFVVLVFFIFSVHVGRFGRFIQWDITLNWIAMLDLELLILLHHATLLSSSIALGFGEGETVYYYVALADLEFIM